MDEPTHHERAVELLQNLGLKEYEAKSFVALARVPSGTAKQVSEISDVPRTRVYDAVRVLETKGLVEIQHSNPQQFRAVDVDEAAETLRREYESRAASLQDALEAMAPVPGSEGADVDHEVWALAGPTAIATRTYKLVEEADDEIVLVVGGAETFTEELAAKLRTAQERGVNVVVGTSDEDLQARVQEAVPTAEVFVSGLEWLERGAHSEETEISRLLLVDRSTILVGTVGRATAEEHAVFGRGFDNGLVTLARRLMAQGLPPAADPD